MLQTAAASMFRPGLVALQKYVAPASTPSRQVFDIILKSGPISATDLFAKAKHVKAPEGEAAVRSKTFATPPLPPLHHYFLRVLHSPCSIFTCYLRAPVVDVTLRGCTLFCTVLHVTL